MGKKPTLGRTGLPISQSLINAALPCMPLYHVLAAIYSLQPPCFSRKAKVEKAEPKDEAPDAEEPWLCPECEQDSWKGIHWIRVG